MKTAHVRFCGQPRADTALALHAILEQGQSSRELLQRLQKNHIQQDQAWVQEMLFGVLRRLPILQFWLRQLLDKPLKQRSKVIEHLILLGLYQLAFSRVSQHAAVAETVQACNALNAPGMKGLVNALLRNFIRKQIQQQSPDNAQIESGLPKWLFKQLQQHYPQQLVAIIEGCNQRAPLWLRVNVKQTSMAIFCQQLDQQGIAYATSDRHPHALILQKSGDITQLPGFEQGRFTVQDGAAQLAAPLLNPQANERILDCCAAPGGKTGHLLEYTDNLQLTALELDEGRIPRIKENLQRLKHNAIILQGNATESEAWWDGQPFDRILLDAPCSATGIIRRYPDIKWLRKGTDISSLASLQQQILRNIWRMLKPGGTLLYATCSILPQENTQQIEEFLHYQSDARLDHIPFAESQKQVGYQILPGEQQMDGFYYARLLKSE